jgi:histidine triad (HIT) family protein
MASVFSKIIAGEIPSYKIAEDDEYYAFLDIQPLNLGHTLVVPKQEIDYIFDLDDANYIGLQLFAKKVAERLKKAFPDKRIGVAVIGLEVPHAHMHLVPINTADDLNFTRPKLSLSTSELKEIQEAILRQL